MGDLEFAGWRGKGALRLRKRSPQCENFQSGARTHALSSGESEQRLSFVMVRTSGASDFRDDLGLKARRKSTKPWALAFSLKFAKAPIGR